MRARLAPWIFIIVAFVFLAVGAFGVPRRPTFTVIGIAFFTIGFVARRHARSRPARSEHRQP